MKETYETYAYLSISDFNCHHSEITTFLGLEPTKAGNKGETYLPSSSKNPDVRIKHRHSTWKLYSSKPKSEIFIDSHIEAILELIEPKFELVKELSTKYTVGINCVGYYTNANPGFHLSGDLIQRVAALGLWVDFDLYCSCKQEVTVSTLTFDESKLTVYLDDRRQLTIPLFWYPRLQHANEQERNQWKLLGNGYGIEWPDLDEHIRIEDLLAGLQSEESQKSFEKWLAERKM